MSYTAISFFCEDIRNEVNGIETIVGILPDTISVKGIAPDLVPAGQTHALPKMSIYTRLNLLDGSVPKRLAIIMLKPDGSELGRNEIDQSVIETAISTSRDLPFCGIKSQAQIQNLPVIDGTYKVVVESDLGDQVSGFLKINVV